MGNLTSPHTTAWLDAFLAGTAYSGANPFNTTRRTAGHSILVPSGANAAAIQAAHDLIAAQTNGGTVEFAQGGTYTWDAMVTWEASKVSLVGNHAKFDNSSMDATASASLWLTSTKGDYPDCTTIGGFSFIGDPTTGRDSLQTAIRVHSLSPFSDVRVMLHNIRIQHQGTGISIGSQAFVTRGMALEICRSKFGIQQEAGASEFSENCAFAFCSIFDNDCHIKLNDGQRLKFYGTSFDFFGKADGSRITSDDRCFYLAAASHLTLIDCHIEFNYGKYATQTNEPIYLASTGNMFSMDGGVIYFNDTTQNPYWPALIKSNANFQKVTLRRVGMRALGRLSNVTHDDQLMIGSETTNSTGNGGLCVMEDCYSVNNAFVDMPSVTSYRSKCTGLRNGVDAPYTELSYKISLTGSAAIVSSTSDSGVVPRNATGSMIKITGAGIVKIPVPIIAGRNKMYPWAFFVNANNAVGTIVVRENYTTYALKADGTLSADTRGANTSPNTKSITGGSGGNVWNRVSWKDVRADTDVNVRLIYNEFYLIEIDTTSMSSGSLYVDDFAWMSW